MKARLRPLRSTPAQSPCRAGRTRQYHTRCCVTCSTWCRFGEEVDTGFTIGLTLRLLQCTVLCKRKSVAGRKGAGCACAYADRSVGQPAACLPPKTKFTNYRPVLVRLPHRGSCPVLPTTHAPGTIAACRLLPPPPAAGRPAGPPTARWSPASPAEQQQRCRNRRRNEHLQSR